MEELKQTIIEAVVEGQRRAYELGYCGSGSIQLINGKDPFELLTVEQIHEEFDIGINMVRKMFNDPELPVQRYMKPFRVSRKAVKEYTTTVSHDYLREK